MTAGIARYLLTGVCFGILCQTLNAQTAEQTANWKALEILDFDKDGYLDADEIRLGAEHSCFPKLVNLTKIAQDGTIPKDDILGKSDAVILWLEEIKKQAGRSDRIPIKDPNPETQIDAEKYFGLEVKKPGTKPPGKNPKPKPDPNSKEVPPPSKRFVLRRSDNDLNLDFEGANPAILSYGNNFENNQDTFSARGVVAEEFLFPVATDAQVSSNKPYFDSITLLPEVAFDRVSIGGGSGNGEVNDLSFKLGSQINLRRLLSYKVDDVSFKGDLLMRASFRQSTDFGFDKQISGGEFDVQPSLYGLGNVGYHKVPSIPWLSTRWNAKGHVEGGLVEDSGGMTTISSGDDFVRVGGYVGITLWPSDYDQLSLTTSYLYYQTVSGDTTSARLFDATFNYSLDSGRHFSLTAEYQNGYLPFTVERVDVVTIGFGIKY